MSNMNPTNRKYASAPQESEKEQAIVEAVIAALRSVSGAINLLRLKRAIDLGATEDEVKMRIVLERVVKNAHHMFLHAVSLGASEQCLRKRAQKAKEKGIKKGRKNMRQLSNTSKKP